MGERVYKVGDRFSLLSSGINAEYILAVTSMSYQYYTVNLISLVGGRMWNSTSVRVNNLGEITESILRELMGDSHASKFTGIDNDFNKSDGKVRLGDLPEYRYFTIKEDGLSSFSRIVFMRICEKIMVLDSEGFIESIFEDVNKRQKVKYVTLSPYDINKTSTLGRDVTEELLGR